MESEIWGESIVENHCHRKTILSLSKICHAVPSLPSEWFALRRACSCPIIGQPNGAFCQPLVCFHRQTSDDATLLHVVYLTITSLKSNNALSIVSGGNSVFFIFTLMRVILALAVIYPFLNLNLWFTLCHSLHWFTYFDIQSNRVHLYYIAQ